MANTLEELLVEVRGCQRCAGFLAHGPRPILRASADARILIAGQAPGRKVHASGVPWDDLSGDRLRDWLGINALTFYDERRIAMIPMGFCYPGKGTSGDMPPRAECSAHWHPQIFPFLPNLQLKIIIGQYALRYHRPELATRSLTEAVQAGGGDDASIIVPHPSPRNIGWMRRNPWFEAEKVPALRARVAAALRDED